MGRPPCPACGRERGHCPFQRPRGCVTVEDAEAFQVAGTLPMLDGAIAVTESLVATLAHEGVYAPPTLCGDGFSVTAGRIAVRMAPQRVVGAVTDEDAPGGPAEAGMVALTNRRGIAVHRTFVTGDSDRMIVRALGHLSADDPHRELLLGADGARTGGPVPTEIDAILAADGRERLLDLCEQDDDRYHRIGGEWVPRIFEYLCESGARTGFAVFSGGLMQACYGRIHAAIAEGPELLTGFEDAAVRIDMAHVDCCAVVRSDSGDGVQSAIELYDAGGNCAALIGQLGAVGGADHREWEAVVRSLCEAV